MYMDFFTAAQGEPPYSPVLRGIYFISADKSYQINHVPYAAQHYVLICTLGGTGCVRTHDREFTLTDGHALFLSPDRPFSYGCTGGTWDFWWFEFTCGQPPATLGELFLVNYDSLVIGLFQACLFYLKTEESRAASSLLSAVIGIVRASDTQSKSTDVAMQHFYACDKLIRNQITDITVSQIARQHFISERALRNIFIKCTGMPPNEYITHIKMSMATYLLSSTNQTINEISAEIGYSSQFYFSRVFKKKYGLTPNHYRMKQTKALAAPLAERPQP